MANGWHPAAGMLLVAAPALRDPNFAESVILLFEADSDGAFGVVINRPSGIPVSDVLETWGQRVNEPEVLFQGGPVESNAAVAVARLPLGEEPVGTRRISGEIGLVDLDTPSELIAPEIIDLRIFAGYAGWGAGQLEAEIGEGDWYVVPSQPGDPFGADQTRLRRDVLRRQPGELAWHSTRPLNPGLN